MAAGSSPLSVSLLSSSLLRLLLVVVAILAAPETASSGDKLVPLVIWHGMGELEREKEPERERVAMTVEWHGCSCCVQVTAAVTRLVPEGSGLVWRSCCQACM